MSPRPILQQLVLGLDDTDVIDSPGTNQLARDIAEALGCLGLRADAVVRHQLFLDPRVRYTSQNGSAAIAFSLPAGSYKSAAVFESAWQTARRMTLDFAPEGSDPGLALSWHEDIPQSTQDYAKACLSEIVTREGAEAEAARVGIRLEALGGDGGGVIGALAALGLIASGHDGRVVHRAGWPWPDDFGGLRSREEVLNRGIDAITDIEGIPWTGASIDLGKRLRPLWRNGQVSLVVEVQADGSARGLKL